MLATLLLSTLLSVDAYIMPACAPRATPHATRAPGSVVMDETILERALEGTLEEEGAENVFMSELGWATYLDQNADSSYNMNERPSMASDNYFTADIFSNPLEVLSSWSSSLLKVVKDPLAVAFPTISNDPTGARSYPKGANEVSARTIKPKEKDFDPSKRITGIPGYNIFGAPGSKMFGED
mmetsp:Transcript_13849/g.22973  ORF Transcript_13849/g.22973 Transcript_13849/m.22973 type:complete len:182 (+) Transcript_13849:40-585(+)